MTLEPTTPPSIRWPGVVFGTIFALAAIVGLVIVAVPDVADRIHEALTPVLLRAEPGWIGAALLMALGVAIVIGGLVFALRRGTTQDAGAIPREGDTPGE